MGTNYYWKKIPDQIINIAKNINEEKNDIFYHIGKMSAAGLYCFKCGISCNREGTARVHYGGPDYSLLFSFENKTPEQRAKDEALFKQQQKQYYFTSCPCCGQIFDRSNKSNTINPICSFTWTMMLHKDVIQRLLDSNTKMIVDENDEEYTPREFMDLIEKYVKIEYQHSAVFS